MKHRPSPDEVKSSFRLLVGRKHPTLSDSSCGCCFLWSEGRPPGPSGKINSTVHICGSGGGENAPLLASACSIVCHFLHEIHCEYYLTQLGSSDPYRAAHNSVYKA